jgi:hypothetical protein
MTSAGRGEEAHLGDRYAKGAGYEGRMRNEEKL